MEEALKRHQHNRLKLCVSGAAETGHCAFDAFEKGKQLGREIVRHGENGLLVPLRDPEALAIALETLLGDKALRETMGARSRLMIEAAFHQDLVVHETMKVYEELLSTALTAKPLASAPA